MQIDMYNNKKVEPVQQEHSELINVLMRSSSWEEVII